MKFNFNPRYNTIALYTFLVLVGAVSFLMMAVNFETIKEFVNKIISSATPFIYGFAITFILNPMLKFFEDKVVKPLANPKLSTKTARVISILITYILAFLFVSVFFWIVVPQITISITAVINDIIAYIPQMENQFNELYATFEENGLPVDILVGISDIVTTGINSLSTALLEASPQLVNFVLSLAKGILNIVLSIIMSVYFFLSKELFFAQSKKLLNAFLSPQKVKALIDFAHESNKIFSGFIIGKLLDSLIIGMLCFIGLTVINMPNTLLVSMIVGITNVIPYFGPFIGAIPCVFIIFIESPTMAMVFVVFILVLQQFDGNILGPKILGDSIGLSAFWVVFSIMVFSGLIGIAGLFIGVPTFAVIYSGIKKYINYRLELKNLSTDTNDYTSNEHPMLK